MAKATASSAEVLKNRPEHPYQKQKCPNDWKELCAALNKWGAAWQDWGKQVWAEVDGLDARIKKLEKAVCGLEQKVIYNMALTQGTICNAQGKIVTGTDGPPTGSTQPPKPPF